MITIKLPFFFNCTYIMQTLLIQLIRQCAGHRLRAKCFKQNELKKYILCHPLFKIV